MKLHQRIFTAVTAAALFAASLFGPADWGLLLRASALNPSGSGTGTESDPYIIDSADDFISIMNVPFPLPLPDTLNKHYRQEADIDVGLKVDLLQAFQGHYDGNGHTITVTNSGVYRYTGSINSLGGVFYAVAGGASVKDLNVELNLVLEGRAYYAGPAWPASAEPKAAFVSSAISGADYFGGITGKNDGTITNCGVTGTVTMTQKFGEKYLKDPYEYNTASKSAESITAVGGIAGQMGSGLIEGCYSGVTIRLGSAVDETFLVEYDASGSDPAKESRTANYELNAGGLVGEMKGGTLQNNLIQDMTVYLGNVPNSNVASNSRTRAYAGGFAGSVQGPAAIQYNFRLGSRLLAALTYGGKIVQSAAGTLAGQVGPGVPTGGFRDNFSTTTQGDALYNGREYAWHQGKGWGEYTSGMDGFKFARPPYDTWGDRNIWCEIRDSAQSPNLKWRSASIPEVPDTFSAESGMGVSERNPRITPDSVTVEIKPTARENPYDENSPLMSPDKIRYTMAVTSKNRLAAPTARVEGVGETKLNLVVDSSSGAASPEWSLARQGPFQPDGDGIDLSGLLPGASIDYYIRSRSASGTWDDSPVRRITVTRGNATMPEGITPAAFAPLAIQAEDPFIKGKLATPAVRLADTGDKLAVTHERPAESSVSFVWGSAPATPLTESLTAGTYTVTAVDGSGMYQNSDPLSVTLTESGGGSSNWTVETDPEAPIPEVPYEETGDESLPEDLETEDDGEAVVPAAITKQGALATPTVSLAGTELSVTYAGAAAAGTDYELRWGEDRDALTDTVSDPFSLDGLTETTYYTQAVSLLPEKYASSEIVTVTLTPPEASGGGWELLTGDPAEGTDFRQGTLATPKGVYDVAGKKITLSYPGSASGVTFVYGTANPPAEAGNTITAVNPSGTYYVQSVSGSKQYKDSPVLTVPLVAGTVGVTYEGNDADYAQSTGATANYTNDSRYSSYTFLAPTLTSGTAIVRLSGLNLDPGRNVSLVAWMEGGRSEYGSYGFAAPEGTPSPLIEPGSDGILTSGVTITGEGATIYYTVSYDGSEPPDPSPGGVGTVSGPSPLSIPWETLEDAFTGSEMRIKAVARKSEDAAFSALAQATYTVANKPQPDGVSLLIGGTTFDSATYYPPGSEVHFRPVPAAGEEIWFTVNGDMPSDGVGRLYAPGAPYLLESGMAEVEIRAVLLTENSPDSPILTQRVNILGAHGSPLFSLENGARIASGQELSFLPDENDLPVEIRPDYYHREGDAGKERFSMEQVRNRPGNYYGVIERDISELGSFRYSDYAYNIPALVYTVDGGSEKSYLFGKPEIRFLLDHVEVPEETIPHTPAELIPLTGEAGTSIPVKATLLSSNKGRYANGPATSQTVSFYNAVAAPEASPETSGTAPTVVQLGQTVSLSCATTGAQIYYSTSNIPEVRQNANGVYEPVPDTNTLAYDSQKGIRVDGLPENFYTIYALACRDGFAVSAPVTFTYRIGALAQAEAPVAYPPTDVNDIATVQQGSTVFLTNRTAGSLIFYSENGIPELTVTEIEPGSYSYTPKDENTKPYQTSGIPVSGTPGSSLTLSAIAVRSGMADSDVVTFAYRIAELPKPEPPKATPATSSDSVATVQPGASVLLNCSTADASIFYSLGGSPVITKNADGSYSAGSGGTVLYSPAEGIKIDGAAGSFVTITAVAAKIGMNPSDIAVFPYQLPAPVQSVYASPAEGDVVKGTEVELSTTTGGATIYYEVETGGDNADDAEPFVSPKYDEGKPIVIEDDTSITAVAEKDGIVSAVTSYEYTVSDQLEAPEPNIPGGSVVPRGTKIRLTTNERDATITYTKDGSDPSKADNKNRMHGAEVALDAEEGKSVSLNAYATKTGMTPSETVTLSYTIAKSGEVFTANPIPGSVVKPGDLITLSSSVTDATIHYTTDGSDPTASSSVGNSVTVTGGYGATFVIRAVAAFHDSMSVPQIFTYTIIGQAAAPSASIPDGAVVMAGAEVSLSAPEGTVHYTLDGSDPGPSSPMYSEPIALTGSVVLKAVAVAEGKAASPVAQYIYTMAGQVAAPSASHPSGQLVAGTQIALGTTTEGASIYYSTDGTDPSEDNLGSLFPYEAPLTISRPVTIKMFAVKKGLHTSVVNTATYTVQEPPPPAEETEEQESDFQMDPDKLFLFDQFLGADSGPLFEDIVLRDPVTQIVLSTSTGVVPDGVKLVTSQDPGPSSEHNENAMRALDLRLEAVYDISLVYDSEEIQPSEPKSVEIGIPIPEGYEDTVVILCHISDNGTVSGFPTRRSGGIAYAVVDHFSKFAIAVPPYDEAGTESVPWRTVLFMVLGLAAAGIPAGRYFWKKRQRQ